MSANFRLFWRMATRSLFRSAGTHGPLTRKRALFLAWYFPLWGSLFVLGWLGFLLDDLLFPGYRNQPVEKPLFILSNFRSGSTFVQRTLVRDAANFTSMTSGHIYFAPSITQRRLVGLLARVDAVLGRPGERLLRRIDAVTLGKIRLHPIGLFDAEEDENILFYLWSTFLAAFPFPYLEEMPPYQYFDTAIPHDQRLRIMRFYRACVQRHLYATGGRYYVSKNPVFSAKIETLLEIFPDARILYLVRNPLDMLPSTVSVFSYAWHLFSDPPEQYPRREEILAWTQYWYSHPLEVLDRDPSPWRWILKYDDLVQSPDTALRELYQRCGYPESEQSNRILRETAKAAHNYSSGHAYNYEEMGFQREQIVEAFADVFARFHFDRREPPAKKAPCEEELARAAYAGIGVNPATPLASFSAPSL